MNVVAPYSLYEEQKNYIKLIREGIKEGKPLIIEAGTGFGKTISNLIAILPAAIEHQTKIAYLSRTHTQNEQVLQELKKIMEVNPELEFRSIQIASRQQLCHINTVSNSPNAVSSILCRKNRELLRKLHQRSQKGDLLRYKEIQGCMSPFSLLDGNMYKKQLSSIVTLKDLQWLRERAGGCAYLASRDLLSESLLVTGHYNYFLDPDIRSSLDLSENVHLVLDEGHNLEDIACSIMSEAINMVHFDQAISFASLNQFSSLVNLLKEIKQRFEDLVALIPSSEQHYSVLLTDFHEKYPSFFPENAFQKFLKLYNDKKEKIEELYQKQTSQEQAKSPFQRILSFMEKMIFKGIHEHYGLIIEKRRKINNIFFELACLDPSLLLKSVFSSAKSVIICSGTLSPLDLNAEILGIPHTIKKSFSSITNKNNILLLQVSRGLSSDGRLSTKFSNRSKHTFKAYREVLLDLIDVVPGGILAFVPSYSILNSLDMPQTRDGIEIIQEEPKSNPRMVLEDFRRSIDENGKALLIGVYGGKFSEGANFPEKESRCVACIGIPYPPVNDPWIRLKREYYNRRRKGLGSEWYAAQAFQKVSQALGRGWRGKNDYAVGLLLDERFAWRENIGRLPAWLARRTLKMKSWENAREKIVDFFRNRQ